MKAVFIIRHAKSSWKFTDLSDVERPLNKRGKKASGIIGRYLASREELPDLIISSPAVRAYNTAVNVAEAIGYSLNSIVVESAIYYQGERGVLNLLKQLEDKHDSVFVFGHEPTCSYVIQSLTGEYIDRFVTASIAKINLHINSWRDIGSANGRLDYFISPRQIEKH